MPQYAFDGRARLPFVQHDRLDIDKAMRIQHVRTDPDCVGSAPRIDTGIKEVRRSIQAHGIAGFVSPRSPQFGNRMRALELDHALVRARQSAGHLARPHRRRDERQVQLRDHRHDALRVEIRSVCDQRRV